MNITVVFIWIANIPPWRWSKKATTCRRITVSCISVISTYSAAVICMVTNV